jgi:hypothetical protein
MSKTLYIVTIDHDLIVAVFDDRALAEAVGYGEIKEYPLNPGVEEYRSGRRLWEVKMRRDGSVLATQDSGWAHAGDVEQASIGACLVWRVGVSPLMMDGIQLNYKAWAKDEAEAIKGANAIRAEWIASGRWDMEERDVVARWSRISESKS